MLTKAWDCEKQAGSEDAFIVILPSYLSAHSHPASGHFRTQKITVITVWKNKTKTAQSRKLTTEKGKIRRQTFACVGLSVIEEIIAQITLG